jgi:hypothetical protein
MIGDANSNRSLLTSHLVGYVLRWAEGSCASPSAAEQSRASEDVAAGECFRRECIMVGPGFRLLLKRAAGRQCTLSLT